MKRRKGHNKQTKSQNQSSKKQTHSNEIKYYDNVWYLGEGTWENIDFLEGGCLRLTE